MMCDTSRTALGCAPLKRRLFLGSFAATAAGGILGGSLGSSVAHAHALTQEQRDKLTPDEILAEMKRGNERFRKGQMGKRDYLAEQKASAKGQYPAAAILSCVDSRVPAELILDLGIGYAFNCRVAGNIVDDDILGSMEFACKVSGAKVLLILGHTSCGAVMGAIDNVDLGNLTGLLAKIRPAVPATDYTGERSAKNLAFVDAVARKNITLTMAHIRQKSAVLRELEFKRALKIAGAMYNLETASVDFFA
jgi:carbonic anhydrase